MDNKTQAEYEALHELQKYANDLNSAISSALYSKMTLREIDNTLQDIIHEIEGVRDKLLLLELAKFVEK